MYIYTYFTTQHEQDTNIIHIRNRTNMLLLAQQLNQQDWNSAYVSNDAHEAHDGFVGVFYGLGNECLQSSVNYSKKAIEGYRDHH